MAADKDKKEQEQEPQEEQGPSMWEKLKTKVVENKETLIKVGIGVAGMVIGAFAGAYIATQGERALMEDEARADLLEEGEEEYEAEE